MAAQTVLVGGGKMGAALLGGWRAAGRPAGELAVVEADPARRAWLTTEVPGVPVGPTVDAVAPAAGFDAVVAVKPGDVPAACAALAAAPAGPPARALSVAAGVTLSALARCLPATAVLRAMPNTPALVGAGAAGLAAGARAGDADVAWAEGLLSAVGIVVRVGEGLLDAVTGLSGSGPAYVFLVAEAMVEGGVLAGLPRDAARSLAVQTLLGSARMLAETGDGPEALRAAVTSPGGTTAAGLRALEAAGVRSAFLEAIVAAAERSRELGA
ncbi:MAG TPA: pyrroline-5-carboxylate reductase [Acidimicrobiales bacterium]|nr:pyrroline-5-carboxylate reductase [Acidimicrobiales bacterium]